MLASLKKSLKRPNAKVQLISLQCLSVLCSKSPLSSSQALSLFQCIFPLMDQTNVQIREACFGLLTTLIWTVYGPEPQETLFASSSFFLWYA